MKKQGYNIIFQALGMFMILFQCAIWITSNKPDENSLINTFWFLIKITVPIITGLVLIGIGITPEDKNKKNN